MSGTVKKALLYRDGPLLLDDDSQPYTIGPGNGLWNGLTVPHYAWR